MIEFVLVKHYPGGVPQGLNLEWGCLMDVPNLPVLTIILQLSIIGLLKPKTICLQQRLLMALMFLFALSAH
jgi:hypothetical protein